MQPYNLTSYEAANSEYQPGFTPVKVGDYYRSVARGRYDMWVGPIEPHLPSAGGQTHLLFARAHRALSFY